MSGIATKRKYRKDTLTEKEQRFCQEFVRLGNGVEAYKAAGYAWQSPTGEPRKWIAGCLYKLKKRDRIAREIDRLKKLRDDRENAKLEFSIDYVRSEHMRLAALAEKAEDLTNATRNLEALGRSVGAYSDNFVLDMGDRRKLSALERVEAKRIAQALVRRIDYEDVTAGKLPTPAQATAAMLGVSEDGTPDDQGFRPVSSDFPKGDLTNPEQADQDSENNPETARKEHGSAGETPSESQPAEDSQADPLNPPVGMGTRITLLPPPNN